MMAYSEHQPRDGETVLHCGHLDRVPHHFFASYCNGDHVEMKFTRPDGTIGMARWMVLCNDCFRVYGDDPEQAMRADAVWKGDEPAIKQDEGKVQ